MLIVSIICILLFGISSLWFIPVHKKNCLFSYALSSSSLCFLISLIIWITFNSSLSSFHQSYYIFNCPIGIDGISIYFILLTTFLFPICILINWGYKNTRLFLTSFLVIEVLLLLVFSVLDLLWFYIFFEAILIPIFLLIGIWGSRKRKVRAAILFFIYTLLGSLFILCGILYIHSTIGTTIYLNLLNSDFSFTEEKWLWLAFFISFAVKVPIFPFHTWLPEAHVEAPTTGSIILAGILLKLGIYGFIRYSVVLFPNASIYFSPFIYTLCTVGILYTSLTAIRQTDIKRLIAYTSVAHINLVVLGIFSNTFIGFSGCIIQSLSHGFISCSLFLLIGILYDRHHSRLYLHYGGLAQVIPIFSIFFLLFTFANTALPGTASFVGEFLLLISVYTNNTIAGLSNALSLVWSSIYSLWLVNRVIYGNVKLQYIHKFTDLKKIEKFCLVILTFLILYLGLYPFPILQDLTVTLSSICLR